jgi:hypothetical protein
MASFHRDEGHFERRATASPRSHEVGTDDDVLLLAHSHAKTSIGRGGFPTCR